jgi:hypothetical protein
MGILIDLKQNSMAIILKKYEASSGSVGRNESLIWQQDRDI